MNFIKRYFCFVLLFIFTCFYARGNRFQTIPIAENRDTIDFSENDSSGIQHNESQMDTLAMKVNLRNIPEKIVLPKENFQRKTIITNETQLSVADEEITYKNIYELITNYTINTLPDSTGYLLNMQLQKFDFTTESRGVKINYSSDSLNNFDTSSNAKMLFNLLGKNISFVMNNSGELINMGSSADSLQLIDFLSKLYFARKEEEIAKFFSPVFTLPKEVYEGMQWENNIENDSSNYHKKFTVKQFFRDKVNLEIKGEFERFMPTNSSNVEKEIRLKVNQLDLLEVNIYSGILESRDISIVLDGKLDIHSQKIPAKTIIHIKETTN